MGLNKTSPEEIEMMEVEFAAALLANTYINQFEEMNLVGNQKYGLPEIDGEDRCEENTCLC